MRYSILFFLLMATAHATPNKEEIPKRVPSSEEENMVWINLKYNSAAILPSTPEGREKNYNSYLGMTPEVDGLINTDKFKARTCYAKVTVQDMNLSNTVSMSATSISILKIWELRSCNVDKKSGPSK